MPSGLAKAIGPVMTAAGIAAAFIPGGQAFAVPLITGGLSQTVSPTGVLGQQPQQVASADRSGSQTAIAPGASTPDIPMAAGGGQAFQATDPSQSTQIAQNMMANNPFATTQVA